MSSEKILPEHVARPAFIYVRQSTLGQVRHHHASRRRQYDLADHARALGWHKVVVIDDDLGKSQAPAGASAFSASSRRSDSVKRGRSLASKCLGSRATTGIGTSCSICAAL
jgi:hypothetical protein